MPGKVYQVFLFGERLILPLLRECLSIFPVVGLLGPKQVGKTTLVKNLTLDKESIYIDLEKASTPNLHIGFIVNFTQPAFYLISALKELITEVKNGFAFSNCSAVEVAVILKV
ncbi:hypothetical protein SAMN06265367_10233 [Algoriphagus winogradskyi]|uniref:AAA domain-containing protein n=1 Tax=Algoriphagus winogradskyi TaxID=237017 RepID=A0ABY1NKT5_9BACT|nr:hypothetical protein SAMN06265367_10233 [Algoriphagus winogradskyi]